MLFNCKNKELISIREHFEDRYCRYVKNFKAKPVSSKTLEILNVIPNCHISDRVKVKSLICTFVKKHIYDPEENEYLEWELFLLFFVFNINMVLT